MAGDWIKMRTDLYRDPKVSVIADALMSETGELAGFVNQMCQRKMTVTRNVMRSVTVGALVSVWGVMRQRGKRNDSDLMCSGVSLAVLDDIADLPGFGEAMAAAGWVVETANGLEFPRFFDEYNVDPEDRAKAKNTERQRRFRERQKDESNESRNVTDNATVTHREEKNREEKNTSSLRSDVEHASPRRGSHLPTDWQLPDDWAVWAKETRPDLNPAEVAQRFADYWHAVPGAKGRKADWLATWRNWVRNQNASKTVAKPAESFRERDERLARERIAAFAPGAAAKPKLFDSGTVIDAEPVFRRIEA